MTDATIRPEGASLVLATLRSLRPTLVPSKRRVATHILEDPNLASRQTITELADAAATSETTVLRLCHQLGLRGYRELRVALALESGREQERAAQRQFGSDIGRDAGLDAIIETITFTDQQAIADTARLLDRAALAEAVAATATARRVDVIGVGASAVVALDLQQKLHRIGITAFAWSDTHAALTAAALVGAGDVLIAVSHTGATVEIVDAVAEAASHGATRVALTGVATSPLAAGVDIVLATADRETTFRSGATASRIAALSVVDVLFVAVAQRRYDQSVTSLELTRQAVAGRRNSASGSRPARRKGRT